MTHYEKLQAPVQNGEINIVQYIVTRKWFWTTFLVFVLTTRATPVGFPRSGGQGLRAARAMRYAAKTPPATDRQPSPLSDLKTTQAQTVQRYKHI